MLQTFHILIEIPELLNKTKFFSVVTILMKVTTFYNDNENGNNNNNNNNNNN